MVAQLTDESEPALCGEGQRRQATLHLAGMDITRNGFRSGDPRYDSSKDLGRKEARCGYANEDGDFCDDDYHGGGGIDGSGRRGQQPHNNTKKKYEKQERIVWIDAPGFSPLARTALQPDGATFQAKFQAKVSGDTGECECSWEVLISVDNSGKVLENKVLNVDCTP